jgi:hypothetical protein
VPNGLTGDGVLRGLFWRAKASPACLCGHHYDKPLDRVVTPTDDHAPDIIWDEIGRAGSFWSRPWRLRMWHGVGAEEVGL